jgi:hypothetical protein
MGDAEVKDQAPAPCLIPKIVAPPHRRAVGLAVGLRLQSLRAVCARRVRPCGTTARAHSLLSQMCNALVSGISWVVTVPGTISTVAPAIVQTGSPRMSTFFRRWSAQRNRQAAFLPAFMSTSERIHGEVLRLVFFEVIIY